MIDYKQLYNAEREKNIELKKRIESLKKCKERFQTLNNEKKDLDAKVDEKIAEMLGTETILFHMAENLSKKPNGRRYSIVEKNFFIALFLSSSKAYRIFREHFPAPCPNTIRNWLDEFDLASGFNEAVFEGLKQMGQSMEAKDRIVSLSFDSTILSEYFSYHAKTDRIDGLVDNINSEEDEESDNENLDENNNDVMANGVLVFLIKGINKDFKEPLGYFFHRNALGAKEQCKLIFQAVKKLKECGFTTKVLCCDQATTNVKMYKDNGVSEETPYMQIDGEKVYCMFDSPHLLKSIRNMLYKYHLYINGVIAKWNHIKKLYDIDQKEPLKAAAKLTNKHIILRPFDEMRVYLACQIFSNSVANAIDLYVSHGKLETEALGTKTAALFFNDLFDVFNSSRGCSAKVS